MKVETEEGIKVRELSLYMREMSLQYTKGTCSFIKRKKGANTRKYRKMK
jgi:hypothetical protein